MISSAVVPDITVYEKYGINEFDGEKVIIFKDYVYRTEKKTAIPRLAHNKFYFID